MIVRGGEALIKPVSHQAAFEKRVLISKGVVPGLLQCATASFQADEVIALHAHESMTEIFFVVEGELLVTLGEEAETVMKGDSFYVLPGVTHSLYFLAPSELFYFNLGT